MTTRKFWLMLCVLGLLGTGRAATAATELGPLYLQARASLRQPPLQAALLASAQQDPSAFRGRIFEVSATVGGLVTAGDDRTALLTVGAISVAAHVPLSVRGLDGVGSGQTIRALIEVERDGNDQSLSNLRVLDAAPEYQVALWERRAAQEGRITSPAPSRSPAYAPQRETTEVPSGTVSWPAGTGPIAPLSARASGIYAPYRNAIQRMNPRLSDRDLDKITTSVLYFSDQYDIDPRLVVAMIIAESGFDLRSTSHTGAMGLGQLMPETARGLGVTDAYDPVQNIAAAAHILRGNLDKYGGAPAGAGLIPFDRIALTMAAYNAGSGAVRKYHGVPPFRETQRYVAKVTSLYRQMCGLKG